MQFLITGGYCAHQEDFRRVANPEGGQEAPEPACLGGLQAASLNSRILVGIPKVCPQRGQAGITAV